MFREQFKRRQYSLGCCYICVTQKYISNADCTSGFTCLKHETCRMLDLKFVQVPRCECDPGYLRGSSWGDCVGERHSGDTNFQSSWFSLSWMNFRDSISSTCFQITPSHISFHLSTPSPLSLSLSLTLSLSSSLFRLYTSNRWAPDRFRTCTYSI